MTRVSSSGRVPISQLLNQNVAYVYLGGMIRLINLGQFPGPIGYAPSSLRHAMVALTPSTAEDPGRLPPRIEIWCPCWFICAFIALCLSCAALCCFATQLHPISSSQLGLCRIPNSVRYELWFHETFMRVEQPCMLPPIKYGNHVTCWQSPDLSPMPFCLITHISNCSRSRRPQDGTAHLLLTQPASILDISPRLNLPLRCQIG